jgi:lipopolysaccharide export system protein LptA
MNTSIRLSRLCFPYAVTGALLAAALMLAAPLAAQTVTNSFGGLSGSSDEPIDIESDVLVVQDKQKLATFKGNVKAVQGTTTLRATELRVHYVGGDKLTPGAKKESKGAATQVADSQQATDGSADKADAKISKIEARGNVIITGEDDQTTTSDWALYDLPAQLVTVGGNVVLTQGKNVLKGDRLVIDLKTGESRFENTGETASGGRIRALFMPKEGGKSGKSAASKSGSATADEAAPESSKPDATPADEPDDPWPLSRHMRP